MLHTTAALSNRLKSRSCVARLYVCDRCPRLVRMQSLRNLVSTTKSCDNEKHKLPENASPRMALHNSQDLRG